jgi:hypothetical protein
MNAVTSDLQLVHTQPNECILWRAYGFMEIPSTESFTQSIAIPLADAMPYADAVVVAVAAVNSHPAIVGCIVRRTH